MSLDLHAMIYGSSGPKKKKKRKRSALSDGEDGLDEPEHFFLDEGCSGDEQAPSQKLSKRRKREKKEQAAKKDSVSAKGNKKNKKGKVEKKEGVVKVVDPERRRLTKTRATVVRNWRRRKVDVREQVDVGGSIFHAVKKFQLYQMFTIQSTTQSSNQPAETNTIEEKNAEEEECMGSSAEKEKDALMGRFLDASQKAKVKEIQVVKELSNFWELGFKAPTEMLPLMKEYRKQILRSIIHSGPKRATKWKSPVVPYSGATVSRKRLRKEAFESNTAAEEPFQLFPYRIQRNLSGANFDFHHLFAFHREQLSRAAARHLIMTKESNEYQRSFNNRIADAIWNYDLKPHWNDLVVHEARLACSRYFEYREFTDRRFKHCKRLGLLPHRLAFGPLKDVGRQLRIHMMANTKSRRFQTLMRKRPNDSSLHTSPIAALEPTSSYCFLPGTVPPSPVFPVEETNFIFGNHDINAYMIHNAASDDLVRLSTLSLLLSRKLHALHNEEEHNTWNPSQDDEAILTYVTQIIELSDIIVHNRVPNSAEFKTKSEFEALPEVNVKEALLIFVNVVMNLPLRDDGILSKEESNDADVLKDMCNAVFEKFEVRMAAPKKLYPFPRLWIIYGLSGLGRLLPISAAEILSRGYDDTCSHCRTPFDVMKKVLEHLETNELLETDEYEYNEQAVSIHVLEHEMSVAYSSFQRAVEVDPKNPFFHAWCMASLAACVLLCSGNRIDSVARLYPSSRTDEPRWMSIGKKGRKKKEKFLPHEVRKKLDNFHDMRKELARAFDLLLGLSENQNHCRYHLTVASFLEWRQVIALMTGPSLDHDKSIRIFIQKLHSRHSMEWAKANHTAVAREYLRRVDMSHNERLQELAASLENNPEDIVKWRSLVEQLGPLERDESVADIPVKSDDACAINPPGLDHDSSAVDAGWTQQRDFWKLDILPSGLLKTVSLEESAMVLEQVSNLIMDEPRDPQRLAAYRRVPVESPKDEVSWISIVHIDTEENNPSSKKRGEIFDSDFPPEFSEVLRGGPIDQPLYGGSRLDLGIAGGEYLEVLCYKALIASHMFGENNPVTHNVLQHLLTECWGMEAQDPRGAGECLIWLHAKGLDVTAPLKSESAKAADAPSELPIASDRRHCFKFKTGHCFKAKSGRQIAYPEAMCKAVKEGLQKFGFKFTRIQNHYHGVVFHQRDPIHTAKYCYHYMIRTGQMLPHKDDHKDYRPARFPDAMREALKAGIKRFGGLKLSQLRRHYVVLKDCHTSTLRKCYNFMVESCEIPPLINDTRGNKRQN